MRKCYGENATDVIKPDPLSIYAPNMYIIIMLCYVGYDVIVLLSRGDRKTTEYDNEHWRHCSVSVCFKYYRNSLKNKLTIEREQLRARILVM